MSSLRVQALEGRGVERRVPLSWERLPVIDALMTSSVTRLGSTVGSHGQSHERWSHERELGGRGDCGNGVPLAPRVRQGCPYGAGQSAYYERTGKSGAAPMPAAATTGSPSCALVPVAEVSALIGIASLKEPEKGGEPPVTACNFSDGRNPLAVSVRYETGRDPATFAVIRKGHDDNEQKTSDFPGLTSGAFSFGLGKMHSVSFLHKNTVVMVAAIAPLDKVAALARGVMDRM